MLKKLFRVLAFGILVFGLLQYYLQSTKPSTKTKSQARQELPLTKIQFHSQHPRDYNEAKNILKQLYPSGRDFYCGCRFNFQAKTKIDASSCGFKGHGARSQRIEWEHVVPASYFGQRFKEWTAGHPSCMRNGHMEKGRNCAREKSADFRQLEADLYNLLPVVGTLNGARSNYPFGDVKDEPRVFGSCDFEVVHQIVEPPREIRGNLARIYFYMDARYPDFDIINKTNEGMMSAWDREDPIDDAELSQLKRIAKIQGNSFFIGRMSQLSSAKNP